MEVIVEILIALGCLGFLGVLLLVVALIGACFQIVTDLSIGTLTRD